ncbi:MAG: Ig-like domain repeat protein [Lachnospiraceae bacterium]|nr:Ig-like domain repeat protein [Lachnospiraceae bacterium]
MSFIIGVLPVKGAENEKTFFNSDKSLEMKIIRDDGIEITPKEKEIIYTNRGLEYRMNMTCIPELFEYKKGAEGNSDVEDFISIKVLGEYAISYDKGENFNDWTGVADGRLQVNSSWLKDGDYCIKFRRTQEYVLNEEKIESRRLALLVSSNCVNDNVKEKTEEKPEGTVENTEEKQEETGEKTEEKTEVKDEKKEEREAEKKAEKEAEEEAEEEKKRLSAELENNINEAVKIIEGEGVHVTESKLYYIKLDTNPPGLILNCDHNEGEWVNDCVNCQVMINDTGSKPSRLIISYDGENIIDESYENDSSFSGLQKEFTIRAESKSSDGDELKVKVYDGAGNVTGIVRKICIDKTLPSVEISNLEEGKTYREPVSIKIDGKDAAPESVCVGYTIKRILQGVEETIDCSAKTLSELLKEPLYTVPSDGDYIVECSATDRAGNKASVIKRSFRVDTTVPGLIFEGIGEGMVLSKGGALKVTAFDNFADGYKVSLKGCVSSGGQNTNLKLSEYKTDGLISSNTYYFKTDGDYSVDASVVDAAGNSYEDSISFSVDTTAPLITVLKSVNAKNDIITNEPPMLSFKITEKNYETADVSCVLKRGEASNYTELCKTPEWVMGQENEEFHISIEEEGSYELCVNARDAAGNTAGKTIRFVLDMTGPQIDYVDNLDRKYVKSFKLPDNFNEYIKDQGEVSYETYLNSMNYDENEEIEEDGKYVLKVSAIDDAGNQAEKTVEFIVDSTVPRVVIDGMGDDGSVNKDETIILSLYDEGDYFKSVKLNDVEYVTETGQTSVELSIPDYGSYEIYVEAADKAENVLTQTIEAKCANASPVDAGTSTIRTLKKSENNGSDKGLRIFLIIMTVVIFAGAIVVFFLYNYRNEDKE